MDQAIDVASIKLESLTISPSNTVPKTAINDVPNEILREIFLSLVDTQGARSALGRVCYRWRQIIRSTSEFWNVIYIRQSANVMKEDPYFWARQAGHGSHPLTVVWEIEWHSVHAFQFNAYVTALRNFLKVAPYSRWRELRVNAVNETARASNHQFSPSVLEDKKLQEAKKSPMNFLAASFDNLEIFEVQAGCFSQEDHHKLIAAVTKTANKLHTFNISQHPSIFGSQPNLQQLTSRVSTLQCERLPSGVSFIDDLPPKIERLTVKHYVETSLNFRNVTHLEIGLLRVSPTRIFQFPNVTILYISQLHITPNTLVEPLHFPKLRMLKAGIYALQLLQNISAPLLQIIQVPTKIQASIEPKNLVANLCTLKTLPCTSVDFQGGIQAEDLPLALSWFPKVESLSVSLSLKLSDPNMSLLCLKSDLNAHRRHRSPENATRNDRYMKTFTYGPNLVSLHLRFPPFEDDYNFGLELAVSVLTERRKSRLRTVYLSWDDGREINLTTDDI